MTQERPFHMGKKQKKSRKSKKTLRVLFFLLFLGVMLFSGWKLYRIYGAYAEGTETYEGLAEQYITQVTQAPRSTAAPMPNGGGELPPESAEPPETAPISVSFDQLLEECKDVVGWLYCEDTKLNYPIVQSYDNNYYLRRLMNGKYNIGGTIFMDYRNQADLSDWNTIIYGHNMNNGSMFGVLPKYLEQEFYDAHPVIYLLTPGQNYKIELISGYVTPSDSEAYTIVTTPEERDALVEKARAASSFVSDVEVGANDRLVTLSTCVYNYENARYVLVGVLREIG